MSNTAFVFPGQGSQSIGMLKDLGHHVEVSTVFEQVSQKLGYDVWRLIQEGPEAQLNQTEYTQVAMLTADVALYGLLQSKNAITPRLMAGHSLGEYAALVCANALTLADAASLVAQRGQIMQETVPQGIGAMAAIVGLSDDAVEAICSEASNANYRVSPANYNTIGQVVIAGHVAAIEQALQLAEAAGAKLAKIIPVSVPCHCSLLESAAEAFAEVLAKTPFTTPNVPVISNVNVAGYQSVEDIRHLLAKQLHSPVRWVETIQFMKAQGVERIVECGPGKVLSGLIKRIDRSINSTHVTELLNTN